MLLIVAQQLGLRLVVGGGAEERAENVRLVVTTIKALVESAGASSGLASVAEVW